MTTDDLSELRELLDQRGIRTMRAAPNKRGLAAMSMSTYSVQEFLNVLAPGPVTGDDALEMRILGRPQDLGPDDVPWEFEAVPTVRDMESGIELKIIVSMPWADVEAVVQRLRGGR